jgi:hypothetical protein
MTARVAALRTDWGEFCAAGNRKVRVCRVFEGTYPLFSGLTGLCASECAATTSRVSRLCTTIYVVCFVR